MPLMILFATYVNAMDFLHQTIPSIQPANVAVVVNQQDDNSKLMGDYYLKARGIPPKNLIVVDIPKIPVTAMLMQMIFTKSLLE